MKKSDKKDIGDRIKLVRGTESREVVAQLIDSHRNSMARYEAGLAYPSMDFMDAFCEHYNLNPTWFLTGEPPMYMNHKDENTLVESTAAPESSPSIYMDHNGDVVIPRWQSPDPEQFDYIPMAEAQLSAGGGSFVISQDIGDYYAFRKSWLSRVASSTKNLVLMRVAGSSMAPTIENDDTVMIDIGKRSIKEGMVYAIRVEDTVMIKRLSLRLEGKVLVISDNRTEFEPFEADRKSLHIIGQIIFFCRTFMTD